MKRRLEEIGENKKQIQSKNKSQPHSLRNERQLLQYLRLLEDCLKTALQIPYFLI